MISNCEKCGRRYGKRGMFIGNDGEFYKDALLCVPCDWVWEAGVHEEMLP